VVYFHVHSSADQILSFLVLLPATQATKYLGVPVLQQLIARMPWLLQFFLAVVVADVAEYFIHLALHKVPFSMAISRHSPFFEGARLDRGLTLPLVDDTLAADLSLFR